MPTVLLALDIDGTLCDSQDLAELFAIDRALWHQEVAVANPPPIPLAVEALAVWPACDVVVVTARPESLRGATAAWLGRHFPQLTDRSLFMRGISDERPGWEIKAEQIERVRGERRVVLVDDDPMAALAIGRDDRWLRAPEQWRLLVGVLGRLVLAGSPA